MSGVVVLPATAGQPSGPVRIDKVRYEQGATLNSEYVVVKNASGARKNLKGYVIRDPLDGQEYTFAKTVVKPGGVVTLHTGSGRDRAGHRYWREDEPMWNNDGDTVVLLKPSGQRADRCVYTGNEGGTVVC